MEKLIRWIKKPKRIVLLFAAAAIIVVGCFYFIGNKTPAYEFSVAKRADIVQEVSVTGRVKPVEAVNLAFERAGRVNHIFIEIGDKVFAGQPLVALDNSEITAQLTQAQAELKSQKAKLNELLSGTRTEEILIQEVKVKNAEADLEAAKKNLVDKLQDAYVKSDDAIRNKGDQLFKVPVMPNPETNFLIFDSQLNVDVKRGRMLMDNILNSWQSSLKELTINSDFIFFINTTRENLNQVKSFLDKLNLALNAVNASTDLSQATIDGWKSNISTARTNIETAISNVSGAEEKLKTAESNLNLAQQELVLKKAGATNEEIRAQEAQVEKAQANVLNYEAQLAKTILRSPIAGVVTKQEAKIGEIVSANVNIVSVISAAKFEIEANVAEADIAKIKIGNPARVTLDAYGEDIVFGAEVVKIEPAETIIEGVTTYKTTFQFINDDERVKSGMTANIDILTDKRENAIIIPRRAVLTKEGDKIVKKLINSDVLEIKVKTGLIGSDGNIEIIEGVNEGDKVITSEK